MTTLTLPPLKHVASPNFSSRHGTPVDLIVCHDCEGSYAGSINWFANPASQVSAHVVLRDDGQEATQMVDFADKAWHVVSFNPRSIGIEMAGYAAKGFGAAEWQDAANIIAWLLHRFNLPCRWAQHGSGPGFCSHYDLGAAGGGHKDPTTDSAVWAAFVKLVQDAYALTPPTVWDSYSGAVPLSPPTFVPTPTVRSDVGVGSVEWAQLRLNALGAAPQLATDGILGPATKAALIIFQRVHKLDPDGVLGPLTTDALKGATT